jgi:TolB-like protein/Flp pilus assembly protein TadD
VQGSSAATGSVATTPSLAVLPFENLGRAEDAYFADGMTEEISSRLGELSGLRIIGRQSVRGYANSTKPVPQIGKELGVSYVLTGSVRWDKSSPGHSRVRVSPALLRTDDGTQVWSEPYEDEVTGVFQIQSKVASRVADALKLKLTQGEQQSLTERPTQNVEAYDYYLKGTSLGSSYRGVDFMRSAALLQRAVELDPKFAKAWAALANAHVDTYWFRTDPTPGRLKLARAAADKALQLDSDLPAAHNALGNFYYHGSLDYDRALEQFSAAQKLAPNDPEASSLKGRVERRQNHWDAAIADFERAVSVDPRNLFFLGDLSETYAFVRRYDDAERVARKAISVDPSNWNAYTELMLALIGKSADTTTALQTLREARRNVNTGDFEAGIWPFVWLAAHDRELLDLMHAAGPPASDDEKPFYYSGKIHLALQEHDSASAKAAARSMLQIAPKLLTGSFFDADIHEFMGLAYATLGDRAKALEESNAGLKVSPLSRDALRGAATLMGMGYNAAIAGDNVAAISAFSETLRIPAPTSKGWLKYDPVLANLRKDPRFQQLLNNSY